jgi:hypothetical protein
MSTARRTIILLALIGAAAAWSAACRENKSDAKAVSSVSAKSEPASPVGVESLMRHSDSFTGDLTVEGVAAARMADKGLFTMIDLAEFEECSKTTCAALALPVRWSGPMPAEGEILMVKGSVEKTEGKLVFAAKEIAKRPVPSGGKP